MTTIATNIENDSSDGYDDTVPALVINPNVSIVSGQIGVLTGVDAGGGVISFDETAVEIFNFGQIISFAGQGSYDTGVYIANGASLFNEHSGSIEGYYGLYTPYDNGSIRNDGYIDGLEDGVRLAGGDASLINTGRITGAEYAVYDSPTLGAATITNAGTMTGGVEAFFSAGDENESFHNTGVLNGGVQLGDGTNLFDGRGGTVNGTITGGSAADTIHLGNDGETVNGGLGHDVIYGGTGADTFEFTSDGAANADGIRNFNVANDIIELSHATFTKLAVGQAPVFSIGAAATSASDHLYYNSTGGGLWYDPDGSGSQAAIEIANLGAGLKLTVKYFTVVA
jgi:Ca2+-binding RTX toxin-like protein